MPYLSTTATSNERTRFGKYHHIFYVSFPKLVSDGCRNDQSRRICDVPMFVTSRDETGRRARCIGEWKARKSRQFSDSTVTTPRAGHTEFSDSERRSKIGPSRSSRNRATTSPRRRFHVNVRTAMWNASSEQRVRRDGVGRGRRRRSSRQRSSREPSEKGAYAACAGKGAGTAGNCLA